MIVMNLWIEDSPSALSTHSSWLPGTKNTAPNLLWSTRRLLSMLFSAVPMSPARMRAVFGQGDMTCRCSMLAPMSACKSLQATTSSISTSSWGQDVASGDTSYLDHGVIKDSLVTASAIVICASLCSLSFRLARSSSFSFSSTSCSAALLSSSTSIWASTLHPQQTHRHDVQSTFRDMVLSWQYAVQLHCVHLLRGLPIRSERRPSSSGSYSTVSTSTHSLSATVLPSTTCTSLISKAVSVGRS
mmetsp:Transcript_35564/g.83082  ORF Transcript_35564/g.83082 Transcript_35564/m.83082 type:complete len:244 (+) Transcript_35564:2301-3032(+)